MDSIVTTPHRSPVDTGRMVWGHQDFTPYTTPETCDRAVNAVRDEVWRTAARDTSRYSRAADTLPTAAVAVGRMCAEPLTLTDANLSSVWSAMRLALATGRDAEASAILERTVTTMAMSDGQAQVLAAGAQLYFEAHPPRLALGQSILARLEVLGKTLKGKTSAVRNVRFTAQFGSQLPLLLYWLTAYNGDSLAVRANAAITVGQEMDAQERDEVNAVDPYLALFDFADDYQAVEAQQVLLRRAMTEVGGWRNGQARDELGRRQKLVDIRKAVYEKSARTLTGTYWFNAGTTPHPAPGKVSLFVHVNHTCGRQCAELYTVIRNLVAKYGDAVDITLITDTYGYAIGTVPILPDSEAVHVAAYFRDRWQLSIPLLVDARTYTRKPDGHVVYTPTSLSGLFGNWELANTVVVDRTGKIRWVGLIRSLLQHDQLEAVIDHASEPLRVPVTGPLPSGG